jgi:EAL domain-containing protein (putative c-di-GMP-specific phosphodiesterase class I)
MTDRQPILLGLDDDPDIGELMRTIGANAGFFVETSTIPAVFKEALRRLHPDVVVLDLQMPAMDGVQMLRWLAEEAIDAGVVLVSGMDERTIASAEQFGVSRGVRVLGTLQKPFTAEDMLEKLLFARAATQALTAADLHNAIDRRELRVLFQPTIQRFPDNTWDVGAVEALVRWQHPQRGVLQPDAFIAMSEREGLGRSVTDFVLQQGIEQLKGWRAARLGVGLRVNVPAMLIADLDFPDRLAAMLSEHEVDASDLTIEITETAMLARHADTFDILTRLRVKNINLAIDDFGIGYSSLTQLFELPFNEMKIDKSLVLRVPQSKEARIMVEALVQLAHKLGLRACAEGVETEDTLEFLTSVACDSAQGFLISRPIEGKTVQEVVRRWDAQQKTQQLIGAR